MLLSSSVERHTANVDAYSEKASSTAELGGGGGGGGGRALDGRRYGCIPKCLGRLTTFNSSPLSVNAAADAGGTR